MEEILWRIMKTDPDLEDWCKIQPAWKWHDLSSRENTTVTRAGEGNSREERLFDEKSSEKSSGKDVAKEKKIVEHIVDERAGTEETDDEIVGQSREGDEQRGIDKETTVEQESTTKDPPKKAGRAKARSLGRNPTQAMIMQQTDWREKFAVTEG